jgi:hypothetical protein
MEATMYEQEVLKLIDDLYGPNKPPDEPKYKKRQEFIDRARLIYGDYGEYLKKDIQYLLKGYGIKNETDWNYDNCFSFAILLHEGVPYRAGSKAAAIQLTEQLGGTVDVLWLELSVMGPYYTYSFSRRTYDASLDEFDHQSSDRPFCAEHVTVLKRVVDYCERKGFRKLDKSLLERIVPGVTLELAEEEGTVTVYNCLFMDVPPESQDYAKA